jgi:lipopolysaccharide transport system permease protein
MAMAVQAQVVSDGRGNRTTEARPGRPVKIKPSGRWPTLDLRELWAFRGLFFFFVWRDIKVRYAQTVLGAGWAILQPVLATGVFSLIFGRFAKIPSDGIPYPLFALAGQVLWTYYATALTGASGSLINSTHLITKVYFPRLVVPMAPVLAGLLDLAIALLLLFAVMLAFEMPPAPVAVVMLPLSVLILLLTVSGVGCALSALSVQYRDVKHATPFLVQLWMYASPIVYPLSIVPEKYRLLFALNPLAGAIAGFRAGVFGGSVPWITVGLGLVVATLTFAVGVLYFRRTERIFADVA